MEVTWYPPTHEVAPGLKLEHGKTYVVHGIYHHEKAGVSYELVGFTEAHKPGKYFRFKASDFRTSDGHFSHLVEAIPGTDAFNRYGDAKLFLTDLFPGDKVSCKKRGQGVKQPAQHLTPLPLREFKHSSQ